MKNSEVRKKTSNTLKAFLATDEGKLNKQQSHKKRSETMKKEKEKIRKNIKSKICRKCETEKTIDNFLKKTDAKDGLQPYCKECTSKNKCKWRKDNPKHDHKYRSDPNVKIKCALSSRIRIAIKSGKGIKGHKTEDLIGCKLEELKSHIEDQFIEGMTWKNHSLKGWHFDHIVPCAYFDLNNEYNQRRCFNYRNLQPMWSKENMSKNDTLPENANELLSTLEELFPSDVSEVDDESDVEDYYDLRGYLPVAKYIEI
jgi:hypothetical protein